MFTLHNNHMKLIVELEKIAEKYGYHFQMFISQNYIHPEDIEITELMCKNEDLKFILDNEIQIYSGSNENFIYEFSFKRGNEVHALIYETTSGYIIFDEEQYESLNSDYDLSGEYNYDQIIFDVSDTRVYGFEKIDYQPNVYRTGIMLREFAVMISKLFNEEITILSY